MIEIDEQIIDVAQYVAMDENKLRHMEEAYGVLESMFIEDMTICLEQRKIM